MKYELTNYEAEEVIDHYTVEGNAILVEYLSGNKEHYQLQSEDKIKGEMHNQAKDFVHNKDNTPFIGLIVSLLWLVSASITGLFGFSAIACVIASFIRNVYLLIPAIISACITFGGFKITGFLKHALGYLVQMGECQDKYDLFLKNEDNILRYAKDKETVNDVSPLQDSKEVSPSCYSDDVKSVLVNGINGVDEVTLEQMKSLLIEIKKYYKFQPDEVIEDRARTLKI